MTTLTIRISLEEKELLKSFAKFSNMSISELLKQSVMEKIEKEIDLNLYHRAVKILAKNEPTTTHTDLLKELGLDNEI